MQVQFLRVAKNINKIAAMPAPKKVEQMAAWFKAAQKAIPEIPRLLQEEGWDIFEERATQDFVVFHLKSNTDERCSVVIDRKASSLGTR